MGLGLNEGLGISSPRRQGSVHLHARDSAPRSAPQQEQSRYSASAAPATDFAWRSAPCSADHSFEFLTSAPRRWARHSALANHVFQFIRALPTLPEARCRLKSPLQAASSCIWMRPILLAPRRDGKSSRGIPRLRRTPGALHGAPRLAARTTSSNSRLRHLADPDDARPGLISSLCNPIAATPD